MTNYESLMPKGARFTPNGFMRNLKIARAYTLPIWKSVLYVSVWTELIYQAMEKGASPDHEAGRE